MALLAEQNIGRGSSAFIAWPPHLRTAFTLSIQDMALG
jgi:hypothetical protein